MDGFVRGGVLGGVWGFAFCRYTIEPSELAATSQTQQKRGLLSTFSTAFSGRSTTTNVTAQIAMKSTIRHAISFSAFLSSYSYFRCSLDRDFPRNRIFNSFTSGFFSGVLVSALESFQHSFSVRKVWLQGARHHGGTGLMAGVMCSCLAYLDGIDRSGGIKDTDD